ncbi:unnamed protein product [Soboliphyme baturini]|uniref:2-oxoisovalerate dehydrogenase subunit alpha n=1 Tax=Soboliphyme baturini TaxID=241478 RepID=A0A183IVC7_9BILA|nr:unnamed protein product [Soboliphyme baturini]
MNILRESISSTSSTLTERFRVNHEVFEPSPEVLQSFTAYMKEKIRCRLRVDCDYEKKKFPHSESVFKP